MALGVVNAGMSILGGLSAIYTLGSSPIGLEVKGTGFSYNTTTGKMVPGFKGSF